MLDACLLIVKIYVCFVNSFLKEVHRIDAWCSVGRLVGLLNVISRLKLFIIGGRHYSLFA